MRSDLKRGFSAKPCRAKAVRGRPYRERVRLLFFLAALVAAPGVFAETTVETSPRQVTVFPDGARVTREGSLPLPAGENQVLFPDLPASVIPSSLRLSVEGPAGTRFYGVSLRNDYTPDVVEQRTRLLKDKLQALEDGATDLSDKVEARKAEIELLKSLAQEGSKDAAGQGASRPAAVVDFTRSAASVGARIALLTSLSRKDERLRRDLEGKIAALQQELSQGGSPGRERRTAAADLELPAPGTARFTLTYQVSGASWSPLYDLQLATEGEKPRLDLAFNASIRQTTGEDWKGVSLTLSTVRPTQGTQVPDPTDWWLDLPGKGWGEAKRLALSANMAPPSPGSAVGESANKDEAGLEQAPMVTARTLESPYAMNFAVPVRRDIPSDGTDHRVGVAQSRQPVQLTLVAVPRLSRAAYLQAHVRYQGEQALLPGQAQLFRDGDFVGTTGLSAKAPGEAFDLGFGQDDRVTVERKPLERKEGSAGGFFDFHKGERRTTWVTTLANYHPGARTLEVLEQLPRSRQKDITVETTELSPKPAAPDKGKPGLYRWRLELAPGAKAKVTFGYTVKFPDDQQVTGLE